MHASPESIGPYRLLELLGAGGMGEVWLAEQSAPVQRRVALKIIRAGLDSKQVVARFEAERQALALMSHPNIARVYDGGTTAHGRPYFVMELIRGRPLIEYCDTERLQVTERLRLFVSVCRAVQHAHQKGILHRDLKPSNLLVTLEDGRPVVKVIDFGIAKAMGAALVEATLHTRMDELVGTPLYMSPEQADPRSPEVDTRTDVYSLGVVLYELLTGALPYAFSSVAAWALSSAIRDKDALRPSTQIARSETREPSAKHRATTVRELRRTLKGDLDWIVMKAIEKDRGRRYATVNELGLDVERHLGRQPVLARAPTAAYLFAKFVSRYRLATAFGAVVLALLSGFAVTTAVQARRIAAERDRANQEAQAASRVSDFLVQLFEVSDPGEARGNTITAREVLDRGAERIRTELAGDPLTQARLMLTIAEVYEKLGLHQPAAPLFQDALALRRAHLPAEHPELADALHAYGESRFYAGDVDGSLAAITEANRIREAVYGSDHVELAQGLNDLGVIQTVVTGYEDALPYYRRALEIRQRALPPDDPLIAASRRELGIVYGALGRAEEAESVFRDVVESLRASLGPDHPDFGDALQDLAWALQLRGKSKEAIAAHREALAILDRTLGPDHPDVAEGLRSIAWLLTHEERGEEALPLAERAYTIMEKVFGPDHQSVARVIGVLAVIHRFAGRWEEAEAAYRRQLDMNRDIFGPAHRNTAIATANLAALYRDMGRYDAADSLAIRRIAILEDLVEPGHPELGSAYIGRGHIFLRAGRYERADSLLRAGLEIEERALGPEHVDVAFPLVLLGYVDIELARLADAEARFRRAVRIYEGVESDNVTYALRGLAAVLRATGRREEAAVHESRANSIRERDAIPVR